MESQIDARGQACPTPVLRTKKLIDAQAPERLTVLVDEQVAVENVSRLARHAGYTLTTHQESSHTRLELTRKVQP